MLDDFVTFKSCLQGCKKSYKIELLFAILNDNNSINFLFIMSNPESTFTPLCDDICQKINDKCDFIDIEKNVQELCTVFQNKWKDFMNPEGEIEQCKTEFVEDSRLVFSTLYKHYGCEEALKEMNECLQEDPDAQSDVDEYLHFVDNLNIIQNMTENDFDEPNSNMSRKLTETSLYIQKKTKEMRALSNTMKNLTNTLEKMEPILRSIAYDNTMTN